MENLAPPFCETLKSLGPLENGGGGGGTVNKIVH